MTVKLHKMQIYVFTKHEDAQPFVQHERFNECIAINGPSPDYMVPIDLYIQQTKQNHMTIVRDMDRVDHDVVCNAHPTTPLGGPMCSCLGRRERAYWHEFGCHAKSTTPSGIGLCKCGGQHPDGTYDHDSDCPAIKTTVIGRDNCICLARRAGQYEHRIP